jgi:hypothetical protein
MKSLYEYLNNFLWGNEDFIVEMATIGRPTLGKKKYHIAIHGVLAGDRPNPHIHIYLNDDTRPYNRFNFEVSLVDILCKDEINIIKMRDESKGINKNNRSKCSWNGYQKLKDDFEDWLFSKCSIPGQFENNLDACVYWYNEEGDPKSNNPIRDYIEKHGLKILDKYKKYVENNNNDIYD